jgi:hypothetical protein
MNVNDVLNDAFGRLPGLVSGAVRNLSPEQLRWAPAPGANSVGWLVWHLTRIQDDHVADLMGTWSTSTRRCTTALSATSTASPRTTWTR